MNGRGGNMAIITVMVFILIGIFELTPLIKKGDIKGFAINLALLLCSCTVLTLKSLQISVPSPLKPIENLIKAIIE